MADVKNPPEGYHTITAYITVDDAAKALEFYPKAFGATEIFRLPMGDKIGHAEIKIGDSHIMVADEMPDMNILGPTARGGPTSALMLYTDDVDAAFKQAVEAGCTSAMEPDDMFWGDRMGTVFDPFGHKWSLAQQVEIVPPEEMAKRMAAFSEKNCG